jgi:hypothetical protein
MGFSPLCFEKPKPQCLLLSIAYSLCRVLLLLDALASLFFVPSPAPISGADSRLLCFEESSSSSSSSLASFT